jgi:glutathione peroxidase-family protein
MRHVYDAHRVGLHYNPVKFLVDHEGNAFKRYTGTAPNDMIDDIEALLKKKEESS